MKGWPLILMVACMCGRVGVFADTGKSSTPVDRLASSRIKMSRAATDQGDRLLRQGEYERAEEAFRRSIQYEPRYAAAHLGLGAVMVATQRFEEALSVLAEAELRFSEWQQMHSVAGLTNRQYNSNREREVRDFAKLKRQTATPSTAPTVEQSIKQEIAAADRGRHIADRLRPDLVDGIPAQVFYLEGLAFLRTGRRDRGIEALKTALLLDDTHALAHYNLAVALFVVGEFEPADAHLTAAIEAGAEPNSQFVADLEQARAATVN